MTLLVCSRTRGTINEPKILRPFSIYFKLNRAILPPMLLVFIASLWSIICNIWHYAGAASPRAEVVVG